MQISDRLKLVVSFVSPGEAAADIGTDHGYVPIELVKRGVVKKAYAMDINKGPLKRAEEHIKAEKLSGQIEVRLSDGVDALCEGEAQTVIIAGMGGELTVRILKQGKQVLDTVRELVLSPHSEVHLVRSYLVETGYDIIREEMILDGGKYYTVMKAAKADDSERVRKQYQDPVYYLYGRNLIENRNPVLLRYLKDRRKQLDRILTELEKHDSASASQGREQMETEIREIERTIKIME